VISLPFFFAAIIFARSLRRSTDTAQALGWNILGAVLGGFCEYASLAWGIDNLTLLAIGLYTASALALRPGSGATPAGAASPSD